jgi:large subunit ribosomal protein L3
MRPMRVLKGKKLAGHMGAETVTIQNLEIIEVNTTDNYILVSGNVPGAKQGLVLIKESVKPGKVNPKEIIVYAEEEVVEEAPVEEAVVEETAEENTEAAAEEVVEEAVAEEAPAEEATEETVAEEKVEETTEE